MTNKTKNSGVYKLEGSIECLECVYISVNTFLILDYLNMITDDEKFSTDSKAFWRVND